MMHIGLTTCSIITLLCLGCSDDSGPAVDAQLDSDASAVDLGVSDLGVSDLGAADTGVSDLGVFDLASGMCAPLGANECFSNDDCLIERRCEEVDVGGGDLYPCCVVGARGALEAGEACSDQNDCASAVCIAAGTSLEGARCSKPCTEASECPVGMQDCKLVAFSDSDFRWCFPEAQ